MKTHQIGLLAAALLAAACGTERTEETVGVPPADTMGAPGTTTGTATGTSLGQPVDTTAPGAAGDYGPGIPAPDTGTATLRP
jgi:hypothetical protein